MFKHRLCGITGLPKYKYGPLDLPQRSLSLWVNWKNRNAVWRHAMLSQITATMLDAEIKKLLHSVFCFATRINKETANESVVITTATAHSEILRSHRIKLCINREYHRAGWAVCVRGRDAIDGTAANQMQSYFP